ncbi:hypothetical protein AAKU52_001047 [Pedobacter sp. CG_S7]
MGSRAIVIVAKNEEVVKRVFGIENEGIGSVYTRTGRAYFNDKTMEKQFMEKVNQALQSSGFYDKFKTDWVCLDTELMPWNAKAQALLESQYASVGTAANHALNETINVLEQASVNNPALTELLERQLIRKKQVENYVKAYGEYCWPVNTLKDYKLAPFHILATEDKVWTDKNHEWHMENIKSICLEDPALFLSTNYKIIDLNDEAATKEACEWWLTLTENGGEGMVIKPYNYIQKDP